MKWSIVTHMDASPKVSYSLDEVCQKTGLSLSTVRRMIAAEQLRKINVGRRILIPASELARLVG